MIDQLAHASLLQGARAATQNVYMFRHNDVDALRIKAFDNILRLRAGYESRGIECLGNPSNVVPVMCGDETVAKWTSCLLEENGLIANLVEFPAVPRGAARFRFCLEEARMLLSAAA